MTPSAPPAAPSAPGVPAAARLLAEGQPAEAAHLLAALVRAAPAYAAAWVLLARAHEAEDQPDAALAAWHAAYFLVPASPLIVRERARLLDAQAALAEAATAAEPVGEPPSVVEPVEPTESAAAEGDTADAPALPTEPEPLEAAEADTPDTAVPGADVANELDALIRQLEDAPRIRPDPHFSAGSGGFGPPPAAFEEEEADDVVSETLARIYAAQQQYVQAAIVYEKLAEQKPEQADEMLRKAAELRARGAA